MKWIAIIYLLVAAFDLHALITNNLAADWQGGTGITIAGGQISQWIDQHQLLNNDGLGPHTLTQSSVAHQPYDVTDGQGYRGVMFPWAYSSANPNTCLNISNSLSGLNTTNLTVYIVATGPVEQDKNQTLIWFNGYGSGWIKFYLTGLGTANYPLSLFVGSQASTIYPPINRSVFVGASDRGKTTMRWNNVTQTNGPVSATITGSGGMVSSYNNNEFYSGVIYRILVYRAAHTTAQMDAQVAELAALYGVLTNYTKQAVCRGDSITAGVGSSMLQSYPFQLSERYPEIEWHNQGIGSIFIGTNGTSGSMFETDTNFVDTLYDGTLKQNWLFFLGGLNDIGSFYTSGSNIAAMVTYGRLTNYVAARKAVRPWTVVVSTVQGIGDNDARNSANAAFNSRLRTHPGNWDYLVDPGINSPVESRLNNPYNLNYYYAVDLLHLTNAGYEVLVEHFQAKINVPHRTTGSFWP